MPVHLYFAPRYFPKRFFAPLSTSREDDADLPATQGMRDYDGLVAIADAIRASGEFAEVRLGRGCDRHAWPADRFPRAIVIPRDWVEEDEVDPLSLIRRVNFDVALTVRDEEPEQRFNQLDRLASLVMNAVDGLDLGERCLPSQTRIRHGRYDRRLKHPEQRLVLSGAFAYEIDSDTGHETHF